MKKDGHPSAEVKLCESGADERLRYCENYASESDVMGSASKRPRNSTKSNCEPKIPELV